LVEESGVLPREASPTHAEEAAGRLVARYDGHLRSLLAEIEVVANAVATREVRDLTDEEIEAASRLGTYVRRSPESDTLVECLRASYRNRTRRIRRVPWRIVVDEHGEPCVEALPPGAEEIKPGLKGPPPEVDDLQGPLWRRAHLAALLDEFPLRRNDEWHTPRDVDIAIVSLLAGGLDEIRPPGLVDLKFERLLAREGRAVGAARTRRAFSTQAIRRRGYPSLDESALYLAAEPIHTYGAKAKRAATRSPKRS
jgi:hypothetical protein